MTQHIIELTAPPAAAPTELGQHAVDITNNKIYLAKGTSTVSDWQEVGAGGGFGVVESNIDEINSGTGTTKSWDIGIDGPLVMKIDDVSSATVEIALAASLAAAQTAQNRLMLMVGESATATAISVTIILSGTLLGADVDLLYVDEHDADFAYQTSKVLSLQNQILFFDITHNNSDVDSTIAQSAVVAVIKTGQTAVTVKGTTGGG